MSMVAITITDIGREESSPETVFLVIFGQTKPQVTSSQSRLLPALRLQEFVHRGLTSG
jgi:hypothetical protein